LNLDKDGKIDIYEQQEFIRTRAQSFASGAGKSYYICIIIYYGFGMVIFDKDNEDNVNNEGKCGKGYGKCASGECCSKYGWCGKTDDHCSATKGCQSEFGKCTKDNENINNESKCGKGYGKCPSGECCSKYGWCGKTNDHCLASKGCQSEFGKCTKDNEDNINNEGKCGKGFGKCRSGECCSKFGWCGNTDDHCLASKGCQSEFGKCK